MDKTLIVYGNFASDNTGNYFRRIFKHLQEDYKDVKFILDTTCNNTVPDYNSRKGGGDLFVIENPINKKYSVITFLDTPHGNFCTGLWSQINKLQQIFATNNFTLYNYNYWKQSERLITMFNGEFYFPDNIAEKWVPISFHPLGKNNEAIIDNLYEERKKLSHLSDKLVFRGVIGPQDRYNVYTNMDKLDGNFTFSKDKVHPDIYFNEMYTLLCGWSISGVGDLSCRDMEILGLGLCMFRTPFNSTFDDQPVEGYHYVKICDSKMNFNASITDMDKYFTNLLALQRSIKSKYNEYKQIGENGRQWYLKNARTDSPNNTYEIFKRKFNIGLLF